MVPLTDPTNQPVMLTRSPGPLILFVLVQPLTPEEINNFLLHLFVEKIEGSRHHDGLGASHNQNRSVCLLTFKHKMAWKQVERIPVIWLL